MATNTAQYEASAISEANQALEQALEELDALIREYEQFSKALIFEMQSYHQTHRRWLV